MQGILDNIEVSSNCCELCNRNLMRDADEMGQYLAAMEEKLHDLTTANVTLEHVILLSGVADALGEMKDSMATVEEYEANLEKLDEAKCAMDVQIISYRS